MSDCVGTIMVRHEFGNLCFAFAFVVAAVVVSGKHDKVTDLINIFRCPVFIGVVCLADFCSKEVVLCFLNIKVHLCDDIMCSCLLSGSIFGEGHNWRNDAWGSAGFELEPGETSGCIDGVHDSKSYTREFG